jgi:hypothetical protein
MKRKGLLQENRINLSPDIRDKQQDKGYGYLLMAIGYNGKDNFMTECACFFNKNT